MRLIDGDKLKEKATADPDTGEGIVYVQDIDEAPAVDAVEVPPVKIGDTAYFIINKKIYEAVICFISWSQWSYTTTSEIRGEVARYHTVSADFSDWNKSVFATMQQAEEALAKLTEKKTVNLEDIVDLDAQTKANNEAMRKVVSFLTGERKDNV